MYYNFEYIQVKSNRSKTDFNLIWRLIMGILVQCLATKTVVEYPDRIQHKPRTWTVTD